MTKHEPSAVAGGAEIERSVPRTTTFTPTMLRPRTRACRRVFPALCSSRVRQWHCPPRRSRRCCVCSLVLLVVINRINAFQMSWCLSRMLPLRRFKEHDKRCESGKTFAKQPIKQDPHRRGFWGSRMALSRMSAGAVIIGYAK